MMRMFWRWQTVLPGLLPGLCGVTGYDIRVFAGELSLHGTSGWRVHLHAFFSITDICHKGLSCRWRQLVFEGSTPDVRECRVRGRSITGYIDRGHYYCQAPKCGRLFGSTNYAAFERFGVKQDWVAELWKQRMLTHAAAKQQIMARGNTRRWHQEIDYVSSLERLEEETALRRSIAEGIKQKALPYRHLADVEEWKLQYARPADGGVFGTAGRFRFLVPMGPSATGKTSFALHLFK